MSNVINRRHQKMSAETKQRVLEVIEALKYTPNGVARQLKSGLNRTIGLIVPSVANPFWGAVSLHIERAAMQYGHKILVCNAERDPEREANYARSLLSSSVRGVILGSSPISFDHFGDLAERGLKIAAFDRQTQGAEAVVSCSVSVDQGLGGQLAGQHLLGLGHRRIAFVSGPIKTSSRIGRLDGLKSALERVGLEIDERLIWQGTNVRGFGDAEGAELGRVAIRELLSEDVRPTAVFAVNDMYALGAYAGARDLGYRVPEDLSIVGFDNIALSAIMQPALTTIEQPLPVMAEIIVAALIGQIEGSTQEAEPAHVDIKPELIVRASTARLYE
ncbi:MAG: LacI family DNA-binding transcriptional regulator [Pseudomonadota bacterium]